MSRARTFADLATASEEGSLASPNMLINGDMAIAQYGTSLSIVHDGTSAGYACDRWLVQETQHDELEGTLAQVAVTDLAGFTHALKWTTTEPESAIAANEAFDICQKIEAQNCQRLAYGLSSAKRATLSFWVKSSVTGTYGVNFYKDDSAGSLTTKNFTSTYAISSADTWEKKTITVPADTASSGGITDDNGEGLRISWHLGTGSDFTSQDTSAAWTDYTNAGWAYGHAQNGVVTTDNATWFLTGVQFEIGDVATPFKHESFADNIARCLRYYQKSYDYGTAPGTATTGGELGNDGFDNDDVSSSVQLIDFHSYYCELRDAPTTTLYDIAGTAGKVSGVKHGINEYNGEGGVVFRGGTKNYSVHRPSDASSRNDINSVRWHFTAQSEL